MYRFKYKNHITPVIINLPYTSRDIVDRCLEYILPYLDEYENAGRIYPEVMIKYDIFPDFSFIFYFCYRGIRIKICYYANESWPEKIILF